MWDKDKLNKLAADLQKVAIAAAKATTATEQCTAAIKSIKYDSNVADVVIRFTLPEEGMTAEQTAYNLYARGYGFAEGDYRRPFQLDGKLYYLIGFDIHARKYHCLLEEVQTGKKVKATVVDVQRAIYKN